MRHTEANRTSHGFIFSFLCYFISYGWWSLGARLFQASHSGFRILPTFDKCTSELTEIWKASATTWRDKKIRNNIKYWRNYGNNIISKSINICVLLFAWRLCSNIRNFRFDVEFNIIYKHIPFKQCFSPNSIHYQNLEYTFRDLYDTHKKFKRDFKNTFYSSANG